LCKKGPLKSAVNILRTYVLNMGDMQYRNIMWRIVLKTETELSKMGGLVEIAAGPC